MKKYVTKLALAATLCVSGLALAHLETNTPENSDKTAAVYAAMDDLVVALEGASNPLAGMTVGQQAALLDLVSVLDPDNKPYDNSPCSKYTISFVGDLFEQKLTTNSYMVSEFPTGLALVLDYYYDYLAYLNRCGAGASYNGYQGTEDIGIRLKYQMLLDKINLTNEES